MCSVFQAKKRILFIYMTVIIFFSDKDYSLEVLKKLTEDWRISYLIYLKY